MSNHLLLDDEFSERSLDSNEDIAKANKMREGINQHLKAMVGGRHAVWLVVVFLAVGSAFEVYREPALLVNSLMGFVVIAGLYGVGLYQFTKKPAVGLGICLGVYLLFNIMLIVLDPETGTKGFIIKGILTYLIGKGVYHATKLPKEVQALRAFSLSREDEQKIAKYQQLPKLYYRNNKD